MENNIEAGETQSQQGSDVAGFDIDLSALENIQVGNQSSNSQNTNVHTNNGESQNQNENSEIEIDERFKDLDPAEARIRTLKSRYDTTTSAYNKLMKDYDERDQVANLFDSMLEDEGLLMAFIAETKPELVKNRNSAEVVKAQLVEEFGKDFKPQLTREEAERDDPFGNDMKYYDRVNELRAKLKQTTETPQSVKDYLKAKKQKSEAEAQKYDLERQAVKAQKKMSDNELQSVSKWALDLKFGQIVDIHRFLSKFPSRNPNITSVPGGGEVTKSAKAKYLDELMPIR